MSNAFDTMRAAVSEARMVMDAADNMAPQIAQLLPGRLRGCWICDLRALKRELRDFDMTTGQWKDK